MARFKDHTSVETRQAIKEAFIKLYQNNNINRITINLLTKEANVNRGTFYYYYQDIYRLLEDVEEEYLEHVKKVGPLIILGVINKDLPSRIELLESFYNEYEELLLLFLVKKPNFKVINTTKKFFQTIALNELGFVYERLSSKQQAIIEYIANAQIGLITWWLENDSKMELKELAQIMIDVNNIGAFTVLKQ